MKSYLRMATALVILLAVGCSKQETSGNKEAPAKPSSTIILDESNFDTQIASGVVLVDFWAEWCGPCRTQGPIVDQVAEQVKDKAKVAKLDVDAAPGVAKRFGVRSIPTLIIFKDGKPAKQFVGVTKEGTLVSAINAALDSK